MIDPVIALSLRLALGLLFASAAWHKIQDRVRLDATVHAYDVLPSWMVAPVTELLPWIEVSIALGLLYPPTRQAAAAASVALLALYTAAIGVNLVRGRREIDCGCFASSARVPLSNWLVARNAMLMAGAGLVVIPTAGRPLLWIDWLTVATSLITLSLLWAAGQRLAQSGRALRLGGTP